MAGTLQLSDLAIRPDLSNVNLDYFASDLKSAQAAFDRTGGIPMSLAESLERNALKVLDAVSPQIRVVIADYERWKAAQQEGACR